ncbi:hypothetical protein [Fulvivirga lutimaris]|uniref:hypothetical protein n=1 Tax=Fulvivirga lutimaris TaxID=1819566 RepID=UPI0012BD6BD2|nr:hypothetical protein [Fulvivirga lutimaris]MTI40542.1 hypothetical protein [Fulvivirga lutimaris]
MTVRLAFLIIALGLSVAGVAQSRLVVKKRGRIIATYQQGDHLKFKLKGENFYYNQLILGFDGEHIKFRFYDLHISEIETVKAYKIKKNAFAIVSAATSRAAIFFFTIDIFNQGIVKGDGFEPSEQTLMITGGLAITSLLTKLLAGNKVKIDGRKFNLEML